MNILHHKSWHVRNKDNILRVRRDEAKAAADEKEKKKRAAIAESEARLEFLRAKSSKSGNNLVEYEQFLNQGHVNLFEQEELGKFNEEKNPEVEAEKKLEKEKFEKKIGLLNYLVDDELDLKKQPWYQTVQKRKNNNLDDDEKDVEVDLKRKNHQDPMNEMKQYFKEKDKDRKKVKKSKHSSKSTEREQSNDKSTSSSSKKTIEQLRAERLKREDQERLKAERLLAGIKNPHKEPEKQVELDDRKRRYNSQFNPELNRYNNNNNSL